MKTNTSFYFLIIVTKEPTKNHNFINGIYTNDCVNNTQLKFIFKVFFYHSKASIIIRLVAICDVKINPFLKFAFQDQLCKLTHLLVMFLFDKIFYS